MDRTFELRLPGDVRHLAVAGLLVGSSRALRDDDGVDALVAFRVQRDDLVVHGLVESLIDTGSDHGEALVGVADLGVLQEDRIQVFTHGLGDVVSAHLDVDELAVGADAVLHVLVLVLHGEEVDVRLLQGVPLGLGQIRDREALGALELPGDGPGVERADVAQVGGVCVLGELVGVDDHGAAVGDRQLLVVGLSEIELAVVFLTSAQLRFRRLRCLRPGRQGSDIFISALIGQKDVPVVVRLAELLDGRNKGCGLVLLAGPGRGLDAEDFDLADESVGQGGLALVKQSCGHVRNLLAGIIGLDNLKIAVGGDALRPFRGDQEDVKAFGTSRLRVDVNDDDNVFRHGFHSFF